MRENDYTESLLKKRIHADAKEKRREPGTKNTTIGVKNSNIYNYFLQVKTFFNYVKIFVSLKMTTMQTL